MASSLHRWSCRCLLALQQRAATSTVSTSSSISSLPSSSSSPSAAAAMALRRRIPALSFSTKAPAAKKGKKGGDEGGGGGAGAEAPVGDVSKVAPINIHKEGKDPPLLPDDQYPDWLFDIRPLTLPEYRKMDISKLPLKEQRRYWKLLNRQVIKEKNAAGQKL